MVYECQLKFFTLTDIDSKYVSSKIAAFIDSALSLDEKLAEYHKMNVYKLYCFDQPFPLEKDGIYKKEHIYTVRIRTVRETLAEYFDRILPQHEIKEIKGLVSWLRIIPKKPIEKIYTLTPMVLKTEHGYWRQKMSFADFENRLRVNLIKKYNYFMNTKIDEDFPLYSLIEVTNRKPIAVPYKGITLLGDKVTLYASNHPLSNELLYLCIGTGICENNSRGFGFVNYRYW